MPPEEPVNPLMRKKKTPEELAREAEEADEDEFTSEFCFVLILNLLRMCKTKKIIWKKIIKSFVKLYYCLMFHV